MVQGADFLQLDPRDVGRGHRSAWLAGRIRNAISDGTLTAGIRLPATRTLALDLGFSRGTVAQAYQRITEEGLAEARYGGGTVIVTPPHPRTAPDLFPERTTVPLPGDGAADDLIDLGSGLPDLASFPRTAWVSAEKEVLATASVKQLGYSPPEGTIELRQELGAWLARSRGIIAPVDHIVITGGVTGALSLLAQVLRDRGIDTVAVEDPGASGNRRILTYWMQSVVSVPVDENGLNVTALQHENAGVVLVTPAHQYPTGVVLSARRRRELVQWAQVNDGLVIEDDYDAEYRYDRAPVRALQPLAPNRVAYTSSLSKTLAPALRMGWLVVPGDLRAEVIEKRWATDLGSPALPQLTLARLIQTGTLERHLRMMRARHRTRRDAAIRAVEQLLPQCTVQGIAGGVHLLLLLPTRFDDMEIADAAERNGVVMQPLTKHRDASGPPGLIINYASQRPEVVRAGIERLAHAMHL